MTKVPDTKTRCTWLLSDTTAYRPQETLSAGDFIDDVRDAFRSGIAYSTTYVEATMYLPCSGLFSLSAFNRTTDFTIGLGITGVVSAGDRDRLRRIQSMFEIGGLRIRYTDQSIDYSVSLSAHSLKVMLFRDVENSEQLGMDDSRLHTLTHLMNDICFLTVENLTRRGSHPSLFAAHAEVTSAGSKYPAMVNGNENACSIYIKTETDLPWVEAIYGFMHKHPPASLSYEFFVVLNSTEYSENREALNALWPYGWNLSISSNDNKGPYASVNTAFRRPDFASDDLPVRLPVFWWVGKDYEFVANMVHVDSQSFPEIVIAGTEAQQKRVLKKLKGYEFERWDGPLVDRWKST